MAVGYRSGVAPSRPAGFILLSLRLTQPPLHFITFQLPIFLLPISALSYPLSVPGSGSQDRGYNRRGPDGARPSSSENLTRSSKRLMLR